MCYVVEGCHNISLGLRFRLTAPTAFFRRMVQHDWLQSRSNLRSIFLLATNSIALALSQIHPQCLVLLQHEEALASMSGLVGNSATSHIKADRFSAYQCLTILTISLLQFRILLCLCPASFSPEDGSTLIFSKFFCHVIPF